MPAVRNIRLCTKDCLCLYVCPTGATDTENGQIDAAACIEGCRACVDACPSHAISLAPVKYPPQQEKTKEASDQLLMLIKSKTEQESAALRIAQTTDDPDERRFAKALAMSNRLQAEDLIREAGYMLPQSGNAQNFLEKLLNMKDDGNLPDNTVKKLLSLLKMDR